MFRTRFLSSARARFVAAAATIFALVALGGVTATPALAAVDVYITAADSVTGAPLANMGAQFGPNGGPYVAVTTDASGGYAVGPGEPDGIYQLLFDDPAYMDLSPFYLDGAVTSAPFGVDRYRVTGTIPVDAVGDATPQLQFDDGGTWQNATTAVTWSGDAFDITLAEGPATYRIQFLVSEASNYYTSYSDSFVVDGTSAVSAIGAVAFVTAGTIRGHVDSFATGDPMAGAVAHAWSGGVEVATGTTDVDGNFRIKVPSVDAIYTVYVDATNHVRHYYNFKVEEWHADDININAGNAYTATGIDFRLELDTSNLDINVVDGTGAYAVDYTMYLYDDNTSQWSSFPYYISYAPSASLAFGQLMLGQYRLVLQHPTTGVVLAADGACYLEFESVLVTNIVFADVLVDPTADASVCDEPAWLDASDASVTGTVANIGDADHAVVAQLWSSGPYGALFPVDSSIVDPVTGDYELSGLRYAYNYFIKFVTDERDPVLDTILGNSGAVWASSGSVDEDVLANNPLALDPAFPAGLVGHDVTLYAAAILDGSAAETGSGNPVIGEVVATDTGNTSIRYTKNLRANGDFTIKVPTGGSYYLSIRSVEEEWVDEYWEDVTDILDAQAIDTSAAGSAGTFDFVLDRTPAQLYVWPYDPDVDDEIIVHLYFKVDGAWEELETQTTGFGEAHFVQDYDTGLATGLDEGDYRVRFETLTGTWIEAVSSSWGKDSNDGQYTDSDTPSCFVDFVGLTPGIASYVSFRYDITDQTTVCGAEPPASSTVTAHVQSSSTWGSEDVAGHYVAIYNDDEFFSGLTDAYGNFEFSEVPNGTYSVEVSPDQHTSGGHEYSYQADGFIVGGGDVDLGTVVATRYGNVLAEFSNWDDAAMGDSRASVLVKVTDADGDHWEHSGLTVEVGSTGLVEAPGILVDGEYALYIEFGSTYAPVFVGGGVIAPTAPFSGTAELDYDYGTVALNLVELTVISGTVFYGSIPLENAVVIAHAIGTPGDFVFFAITLADGSYELGVPPGFDYEVVALFGQLQLQFWQGHNYSWDHEGDYSATPITVGADPVENINFTLIAGEEVEFDLFIEEWDAIADDYSDLAGVTVHLYKKVSNGWKEVDTAVTDPHAMLESAGDGEFRLRFSLGGQWLAVHDIYWENLLIPFDESDGLEEFDPAVCYYDFSSVDHGSYISADISLDPESTVICGAEPALVVPATTTTTKPKPVANTGEGAAEVEPTSTSTATPSPEPSEEATDEPTDETVVDKPGATSNADFAWAFWLAGILALLVLAGGAVYFVRRR